MPAGVPGFILYGGGAVRFLQTPKEVTMIFDGDMQVRHVYMDVPHSANVKPSCTENRSAITKATRSSSTP
jgi:hypothetical protein